MNENFDITYKFLILGDTSVGKTSFIQKYSNNSFNHYQKSTVGIDYSITTIRFKDKNIKIQIWDTAGQERYRSIVKSFYQGANGILLMFDISNMDTFTGITSWLKEINELNTSASMVLVGNKSDLEKKRAVTFEAGKELADSIKIPFFETSAKLNTNLSTAFYSLVECSYNKFGDMNKRDSVYIDKNNDVKKKKNCC